MIGHRSLLSTTIAVALLAGSGSGLAGAAEPTMALSAVTPGMSCTARTVIRGTQISTFDVQIVDVISAGTESYILARASGEAVNTTGVAQGFSGSPVYCPTAEGGSAIAGAVSAGTGDYGNLLVLVTPIESMLREPVTTPAGAAKASSLGTLSVTGISGPVAAALRNASKRAGRQVAITPGVPRALTLSPPGELVPGSSVAAGYTAGAVQLGAVGTVTYVDGNRIWAFGHPLEGAGRRGLLLQNAYVHAVVGNPLTIEGATPYKLASTLGAIGTLTDDRPSGVSGLLGTLPRTIPLTVSTRNTETGQLRVQQTDVTDEIVYGPPTGATALELVIGLAVAQASFDALRAAPTQMLGRMCVRIRVAGRDKPFSFCNRYAGASASSPGGGMPTDASTAAMMIAGYRFAPLAIRSVDVQIRIAQRPALAYLRRVTVNPASPRAGQRVTVRAEAVVANSGEKVVRTHRIRIPRSAGGPVELKLRGRDPEVAASGPLEETLNILVGGEPPDGEEQPQPRSLSELAERFGKIARDDRVVISAAGSRWRIPLKGIDDVRLTGSAERTVWVRR